MAKRGTPKKFNDAVKARIIDGLLCGMSLTEMLTVVGFSRRCLVRERQEDPAFAQGVKAASALGKLYHLQRIKNADERWQASAWFLERKYGAEFGQKVKVEHAGQVEVSEVVIRTRQEAKEALSNLGEASRFSGRNGMH